jgi:CubicO group peptidase (beta-lactamase class C family)
MTAALILAALATTTAADLQPILDRLRVAQEIPGVSAVVTRGNTIVFAGASGVADIETRRAMTADTTVYAGSLSKILTAVLTLQLVEDDKLSLNTSVPGIAACPSVRNACATVRDLLTHTSGLEREGNFGYWFNARFPNSEELSDYLLATELRTRPGSVVHYSNIGYAALGVVIAHASGQDYAAALSSRILDPLGMSASGILRPGANLSSGYSPPNRVLPNSTRPFAGLGRRIGNRTIREYHDAKAMAPAFGAYTTALDLSKLARFLLGYADSETLSGKLRSQVMTRQKGNRGLGIRLAKYNGRDVARHGGWFAAHQSHLLLDLESGIGVVVLANSDSASPAKIAEALLDRALELPSHD